MKSRTSVLALGITALLSFGMTLSSCSSSSSSDTTMAAADMKVADTNPAAESENSSDAETTEADMGGDSAYCTNAMPLKALNLKKVTSDMAGGAAMALDSVMGEFSESLQTSAAAMQEFLMEAATSASAKDGSSHQGTLDQVLAWFNERC